MMATPYLVMVALLLAKKKVVTLVLELPAHALLSVME
jgi:hypothetical protein